MKFSGFIAWSLWRSVYLLKLPRLAEKLRVLIAWTLDLLFGRDIKQIITLRDVQELSESTSSDSKPNKAICVDRSGIGARHFGSRSSIVY